MPGDVTGADKLDARLLRIAGVCALAVLMAVLDTTVVGVAQRTFIAEFESTQAVVAWTMTGYTLALATVVPLAGWAADRFGTKRLFIASVLAFTAGSMLCATAPNLTLLIVFRVVQGLGGGMLAPLAITILTREAGPRRIGRLMAILGVPMLIGPLAGPVLGGWLIGSYSWRWIFGINLPVGLTAIVLAAVVFAPDRARPSEAFDFVGMLLLSPGLAALLYGVSSIPGRGTVADGHVWIPALVGAVLISGFVVHALHRTSHPLIDLRLFQNREVTAANGAMLLSGAAFFGAVLLIPSCFQQLLHQTPLQSGVHMIPERFGAMLTLPLAGWLMDRRGPDKIVLAGITLIGAGLATFAHGISTQAGYLPILMAGLAMMGMGMGCTTVPLIAAAVQSLAPHQVARGSALIHVNLQFAGSISTALMSVILTSQFNSSENISAANKFEILRQEAARRGVSPDPSAIPQRALAPDFMSNVLHDLSHAYTVVFVVAVVLLASSYIPAAFLPKKPVGAASAQVPVLMG
ncbi:DHA2 family efflux MFS transporter permease subunit [Mycobacterium sp.]|uniref:DHA2 family efflux MFS transporter permease subunit n=1 Tax=Mycobacterium sp. TaxID=1785 RepID=UPI0031CF6DF9